MEEPLKYTELNNNNDNSEGVIIGLDKEGTNIFYKSILFVLSNIKNKNIIELMRKMSQIKPIYNVQTIVYLLKEFSENNEEINERLEKLKYFNDYKIDLFKFINLIF